MLSLMLSALSLGVVRLSAHRPAALAGVASSHQFARCVGHGARTCMTSIRAAEAAAAPAEELAELEGLIKEQGAKVRDTKALMDEGKADKADVDGAVAALLELKSRLPEGHEMLQGGKKKKKKGGGGGGGGKKESAATEAAFTGEPTMDDVINVCKRRGFIFQSSEVYGGFAGFFDYGPLGVELRQNIKKAWWRDMVHRRDDVVGLDSSIIASPQVWRASGHVDGFSDPMVDCKVSKLRYRADQLFWARAEVDGELLGYVSLLETDGMQELATEAAEKLKRKAKLQGELTVTRVKDYTEATEEEQALIPSPATGEPGSLTAPREFNLMFQTNVGAMSDASSVAYLRPETAQGIFTNFKNIVATGRVKVPFGIAQVGKAFRNEITPRNFIFRSREFEQMEIEYFIPPDEDAWKAFHEQWLATSYEWLLSIGLRPELLSRDVHPDHKLAHYARACTDLDVQVPLRDAGAAGRRRARQLRPDAARRGERQVDGVLRRPDQGEVRAARHRAVDRRRPADARGALLGVRRGHRRRRGAQRAALPPAPRADQGRGLPPRQEQARADGEGGGRLRATAAALPRDL